MRPVVAARSAVDLLGDVFPVLDVRRLLGVGRVELLGGIGVVPEEHLVGELREHLVMGLVPLADHRLVGGVVGIELDRRIGCELIEAELDVGQQLSRVGSAMGAWCDGRLPGPFLALAWSR